MWYFYVFFFCYFHFIEWKQNTIRLQLEFNFHSVVTVWPVSARRIYRAGAELSELDLSASMLAHGKNIVILIFIRSIVWWFLFMFFPTIFTIFLRSVSQNRISIKRRKNSHKCHATATQMWLRFPGTFLYFRL